MAEPVFRTLEIASQAGVTAAGSKITYHGLEHIPLRGGAVVAINHTSYIDWLPSALATRQVRRRIRYMIKAEMQQVPVVSFLIKHSGTIPVDRSAGLDAYNVAVDRLRSGELVGVYPEATISRSFELKDFKSGAARMAAEAQLPIVPMIVWGAHRIWTKDHPKRLGRNKIPMIVKVGEPLGALADVDETNVLLHEAMNTLLYEAQEEYAHPPGEWWVPRRLGGTAPTLEEAKQLDEAELAERARKQAERAEQARLQAEREPRSRR